MYAIQAVYDGKTFQPQEAIPVARPYDVVITFVKPREARKRSGGGNLLALYGAFKNSPIPDKAELRRLFHEKSDR